MDGKFSKMEELIDDITALGVLARAKDFDSYFKKYLEKHPESTVVNLGCGLDTTFFRVDNGKIKWFDLDLPGVIDYRKRFISESNRNKFIAKPALDFSWFDDVEFDPEKGIFFMAGGLIYYFSEDQIYELFMKMADYFIGGEMIFDIFSSLMLKLSDKELDKYVKQGKLMRKDEWALYETSVDKPEKYFSSISNKLKVIDIRVIGHDLPPKLNLSKNLMLKIKIAIFLKVMKVVHLRFLP